MNKGISLISLIITIIIMSILTGVTIYTSNIIENAKFQKIFSNMQLIRTKVNIISEKVAFEGEQSKEKYYIGVRLKDQSDKAQIAGDSLTSDELEDENYYVYNQDILNSIGLNSIKLKSEEIYIVNYSTLDIIYPKGCKNFDGETVYSLYGMME